MKCSVLSSGSKANSTYIETNDAHILIDCGLSCKQCEKSLNEIGINPDSIDLILVTHSHNDHIKGIDVFSNKHKASVWATNDTLKVIKNPFNPVTINSFSNYKFNSVTISTVPTCHDVSSSVSFKLSQENFSIGYLTDTGCVTKKIEQFLMGVNALVLEFNHDPIMLQTCDYSWSLKQRIASDYGHLSNVQASEFLRKIYHLNLKMLFLAHISENSNMSKYALKEAKMAIEDLGDCMMKVTGYSPTQLYDLSKDLKIQECYKVAI